MKNIRKYILRSYNHLYVNDNDYPLVSVTQKERNDIKKNLVIIYLMLMVYIKIHMIHQKAS